MWQNSYFNYFATKNVAKFLILITCHKKRGIIFVFLNAKLQNTKIRKKLYIKIDREGHLMLKQGCQHP